MMSGELRLAGAAVVMLTAVLGLSGCKKPTTAAGGRAGPSTGTVQGWTDEERGRWYNAGQGSRLMPMAWFEALEQPQAPGAAATAPGAAAGGFRECAYRATFGLRPPWGKSTLPVGFAENAIDDSGLKKTSLHWTGAAPGAETVKWVGLTCAACHTAQLTYQGKPLTVDGAPSLFDFQSFIEALDAALVQTRAAAGPGADAGRWDRFAKAVLGAADTPETRIRLRGELDKLIAWEAAAHRLNGPDPADPRTNSRYGYGRVDAVGHIYNRVLLFGGAAQPRPNPADAPVSYPHLWNINLQTRLQWNGIAQTAKFERGKTPTDFGALGRNTGEVLGVFGEAVITKRTGPLDFSGFPSSVDIDNLNRMEVQLTRLEPPKWPATFGTPSAGDVKAGSGLFGKQCASCHTPQKTYETMKTFADMGPDQTDEWMACNAWAFTGASGAFKGVPANYADGALTAANAPVRALLTTGVKGVLVNKKLDVIKVAAENFFGVTPLPKGGPQAALVPGQTAKDRRLQLCQRNAADPLLAYKARPLEGIWATAPYLHNGSVPTLYDLLLAVEQRPQTFMTGTRAYDPKKAGYETAAAAAGNSFTFDTSLSGNSNKGHVYGVGGLTEAQRLQLLEYLKTL